MVGELEDRARRDGIGTVGRVTARLLSTLVHAMQANRVLDIGTGYGGSALWMALALPPAGRIWCFEPDRERSEVAKTYLERAGRADAAEIVNQPALEVLERFPVHNLDVIFLDVPDEERERCLEPCIRLLKLSGLILVPGLGGGELGQRFLNEETLDATLLPIEDGLAIGSRIE